MTAARPSSLGRLSQRGASPRPSAVASAAGGSLRKTQRSPLSGGVPTPSRVEPFNGRAHHPSAAIIITRYVPAGPRSQAEGQGTPPTGPLKAAANHTPCFTLPTAPPASCWGLFLAPALA